MTSTVALIPARSGSIRVPNKNVRELGGKPLIVWTIEAAQKAGLDDVFVSSDSEEIGAIAKAHGAVWIQRPDQYAANESPDIEWVNHANAWLKAREIRPDIFAILRPTSPFRDAPCIQEALKAFLLTEHERAGRPDSLRCMRLATEHPAKTWFGNPGTLNPMTPAWTGTEPNQRIAAEASPPMHSRPTQSLPKAYVQTAGMELVWREAVERTGKISGDRVCGWLLEGPAALDINEPLDWERAEAIAAEMVSVAEDARTPPSGSRNRSRA